MGEIRGPTIAGRWTDNRVALTLLVAVSLIYVALSRGVFLYGDDILMFQVTESIVERGTFAVTSPHDDGDNARAIPGEDGRFGASGVTNEGGQWQAAAGGQQRLDREAAEGENQFGADEAQLRLQVAGAEGDLAAAGGAVSSAGAGFAGEALGQRGQVAAIRVVEGVVGEAGAG